MVLEKKADGLGTRISELIVALRVLEHRCFAVGDRSGQAQNRRAPCL
jgi:hypothetical protein